MSRLVRYVTCALSAVVLATAAAAWAGTDVTSDQPVAQLRGWSGRAGQATGRLLVQVAAGADARQVLDEAGTRVRAPRGAMRRIRGANIHVVEVDPTALESVRAALAADPRVRFVEQDRIVAPALVPDDASFGAQYHLKTIGALRAWNVTTGGAAPIAILDSGVDGTHPDLAARMLPGRNVYDDNDDARDVFGHGTKVAGAVAAAANNGIGVAGITWANPILPVRITAPDGTASFSTIAEGLVWAADHGARVANVSFAVFGAHSVNAAAQYFVSRGGLVFAAGGNDGVRHNDAPNDWVVSIAATDTRDRIVDFSSTGEYIDLAAPGVDILTTTRGGGYALVSGTSIASPIAAGAAALVFAANPALTPVQVEDLLKANSHDRGVRGYDTSYGWGRVDAARAVSAAMAVVGTADATPPVAEILAPTATQIVRGEVAVQADAADDTAVVAVELMVDDVVVARSENAPHTFVWDSRAVRDGMHRLVVCAWDAAGNSSLSVAVEVSVDNSSDREPPRVLVLLSRPSGGVQRVRVQAADDGDVTRLTLYIDGHAVAVKAGSSVRSLSFAWDMRTATAGRHQLIATAVDAAGHGSRSPAALVDVAQSLTR